MITLHAIASGATFLQISWPLFKCSANACNYDLLSELSCWLQCYNWNKLRTEIIVRNVHLMKQKIRIRTHVNTCSFDYCVLYRTYIMEEGTREEWRLPKIKLRLALVMMCLMSIIHCMIFLCKLIRIYMTWLGCWHSCDCVGAHIEVWRLLYNAHATKENAKIEKQEISPRN